MAAGLEGLTEAEGGWVCGLDAQGGADVVGGGGQVVFLQGKACEDEICGGVGRKLEGGFGFSAGGDGVARPLTDLGEAGVAGGGEGIGEERGLELLFSGGEEALDEVVAAELGVLRGLLGGGQGGEAHGAHLVKLECGLAEGGFGVGAAQAGGGLEL